MTPELDGDVNLLGRATVAARCEVTTRQVDRWIKSGALKAYKLGRLTRVLETDLVEFLASRLVEAA